MLVFTLSVFNAYISFLYLGVSTLIAKRPSLKVMSPWTFADLQTGLAAQISRAPYPDQGLFLPPHFLPLLWPSRGYTGSPSAGVRGGIFVCRGSLHPAGSDETETPFSAAGGHLLTPRGAGRGVSTRKGRRHPAPEAGLSRTRALSPVSPGSLV